MYHRTRKAILIQDPWSALSRGGPWAAFKTRQGDDSSARSSERMRPPLVSLPLHEKLGPTDLSGLIGWWR